MALRQNYFTVFLVELLQPGLSAYPSSDFNAKNALKPMLRYCSSPPGWFRSVILVELLKATSSAYPRQAFNAKSALKPRLR